MGAGLGVVAQEQSVNTAQIAAETKNFMNLPL